jgi:imidazole glycerol phosphate synthase glutamine amidotransferase subunit
MPVPPDGEGERAASRGPRPLVAIIRTGTANLASVVAAFERLGCETRLTTDAAVVANAPLVVLPGVGAFGAGMSALQAGGLARAVIERATSAKPLLAVCLGLQLLCEESEESPGVAGLGIVRGRVTRFTESSGVRVPQLGWNAVTPTPAARVVTCGTAYYANSFKLDKVPPGWEGGMTTHGFPFVAAIERGNVIACQFHPELSGAWGAALLARWVALAKEPASC